MIVYCERLSMFIIKIDEEFIPEPKEKEEPTDTTNNSDSDTSINLALIIAIIIIFLIIVILVLFCVRRHKLKKENNSEIAGKELKINDI